MLNTLLWLIPVVFIGALVWNYRRQAAAREAASAERMKAFMEKSGAGTTASPAIETLATPAARTAPSKTALSTASPLVVSGVSARAQLIDADQLPIYQSLKSALPDYEVLPRMSLAAFLQSAENLTGFAREAQQRRLAEAFVDYLICEKSLAPLAAVRCGARSGAAAGATAFAAACVASAGVRWVEISPLAPTRDALRALVLGA